VNPLQELQAIVESLLFRIGDEQMPAPMRADLTLIFSDGKVMNYGFQLNQPGDEPLSIEVDVDIEDEP
jgi:hypothetical protein